MKAESLEPSEPRKTPQPHTATPSWDFRAVALRVFTAPLTLLHRCLAQSNIHRRKSDSLAAVRAPWMQELQKLRRSRRLIARDTGCTRQRSPTSLERSPQNRWLAGLFDCTTGPGTCSALELLEGRVNGCFGVQGSVKVHLLGLRWLFSDSPLRACLGG